MMQPAPIANSYWLPGGRVLAGEYPADKDGPDGERKIGQLLAAGVTSIVDLTTPADGLDPYLQLLSTRWETGAVHYHRAPIPDVSVPTPRQMVELIAYIDREVADGRTVYLHCWGGVGRTGTVVGCYLVHCGYRPADALAVIADRWRMVEKVRRHPESPETRGQLEFVRRWPPSESVSHTVGPFLRPQMLERFRGCVLGGAVGDALGAAVEFMPLYCIRQQFGPEGITDPAAAYGRVGAITDDTQMSMFTVEGILRGTHRHVAKSADSNRSTWTGMHHFDPGAVRGAYLRWLSVQGYQPELLATFATNSGWLMGVGALHSRRAPGATCTSALMGAKGQAKHPVNDSKGCGGVMRVAPAGLVQSDDPFAFGAGTAAITHGHPNGYLAAGALAVIVHNVARDMPLKFAVEAAVDRLATEPVHGETTRALEQAVRLAAAGDPSPETVESLGQGWVAEEALAIAVYCALVSPNDFARGVRLAVNHSGDSDSTGAIAGNILGAKLGVGAIPDHWLSVLELRAELEALAEDLLTGFRQSATWADRYPIEQGSLDLRDRTSADC